MSILSSISTSLALFCLGLSLTLTAQANTFETVMANGMKVIVKEDKRAPTVVHMVWYRAGSIDEVNGKTGVAHVLEHMMFKGTKNLKPGDFSKKVAEVGGRDNAFTSKDYTAYFQQIEKSHLPKMMALEAERLQHLRISEEEFKKEIQVVMEERRLRTDDQAQAILYEQLLANAFVNSPYRRPIIGWMDDLKNMTYRDAWQWYQDWYAPNNAILVVAGDVDAKEVFRLAEQYYGVVPSKKLPDRKPQEEIRQIGKKHITVKAPAENQQLMMAWKVPKLEANDLENIEPYALAVLSGILDGYTNARLNKSMVKEQRLANSVDAYYEMSARGPQLFIIGASLSKQQQISVADQAIRKALSEIAQKGVRDSELKRVQAQIISSQIYKRDSVFAQAMEIGMTEIVGISWREKDQILERLQRVKSLDIQRVIQKYFIDDALTVAVLDPQPLAQSSQPRATIPGGRH
ncbi:insulinase family protein [Polynucleobacter sp. MWH-Loch1C5]|jgi:zinc protease|uniref:M16 family metallopeptidase n=1 Tax=Polynucleobacter sp. MWH-Loch1C5 TaxID=2689108 RepID=UPI001C0B47DA|nr:pitrilysin family protein [Polynucleobacter sp. MWH-Loch1C5]MBU3542609.1 insulinase family protein [Polynucleobacter sp. MWH-Loch1C5]